MENEKLYVLKTPHLSYLHYDIEKQQYEVKNGLYNACLFTEKQAIEFIEGSNLIFTKVDIHEIGFPRHHSTFNQYIK